MWASYTFFRVSVTSERWRRWEPQPFPGSCPQRAVWEPPGVSWGCRRRSMTSEQFSSKYAGLTSPLHGLTTAFSTGCWTWDTTAGWMQKQLRDSNCLPLRAKEWSPRFALHCNYLVTFKTYRCPTLTAFWFNWYMVVCGALGFLTVPLECAVTFNGDLFFSGYTVTQDEQVLEICCPAEYL